ncbi:MAG: DUF4012 domain-containing protein [Acidimicrobiia bacterium]
MRTRTRWLIVAGVVVVVVGFVALALFRTARAARLGVRGKSALLRAEHDLGARRVGAARQDLLEARGDFAKMRRELDGLGPLAPVARVTPFLRVQMRGAEAFTEAGKLLSDAGLRLADASALVIQPKNEHQRLADALADLRTIRAALTSGIAALDVAAGKVGALDGYRLVGPLDAARRDLARRLPRVGARAFSARDGVDALIDLLGGSGPRRFLVFSQNPDEVRPTGGFIGTYGVLATAGGHLDLERYDSIESWYKSHPQAQVPAEQAAAPLRLGTPPSAQTIANVNATADFPAAARLAADLWKRGGEAPVDGVFAMTPDFMARILAVLGPVAVPGYDETVTSANLLERVDFHTHLEAAANQQPGGRKAFVAELAHVVMQRLLDAPASKWEPLARAVGKSFDAKEAMAWSNRPVIGREVAARAWDGALPEGTGDFFYQGEFEYTAKNGRGLKRTFDHTVDLRADGSAKVTTKVTIANTRAASSEGLLNIDSLSFVTAYGPTGATLDAATDPPDTVGTPIAGHPNASWFVSADPLASASYTVAWDAPNVARRVAGGALEYRLRFLPLAAHTGDVLELHVNLPKGWKWEGAAPPASAKLDAEVNGAWRLVRAG